MIDKATDAAMMFWQALDDRERRMLLYGAAYVAVVLFATIQSKQRDRLKQDILDELAAVSGRS